MFDSPGDLFLMIIAFVLIGCLVVFFIINFVCFFWFPCSFDHLFARGLLSSHDFCTSCGLDLRPPRCECGALAQSSGYCPYCGFCFDHPEPLVTEVTGDE